MYVNLSNKIISSNQQIKYAKKNNIKQHFKQIKNEIFQQNLDSQVKMRPAPVVENNPTPLLQNYSNTLGIASAGSSLYVFYPDTIKVYEDLCSAQLPQLSEELIISQGKIVDFAVNLQYIVVLFQDNKLQIRSRGYWQKVQYSLNLSQHSSKIQSLQINHKNPDDSHTFMFINFDGTKRQSSYVAQSLDNVQICTTAAQYQQIQHIEELGNIKNFYLGLINNQIRFGTYYKADSQLTNLSEFQFGKIKQENQNNLVHFFVLLNEQNKSSVSSNVIYLVKLVSSSQNPNKITLKYRKFFQETSLKGQNGKNEQQPNNEQKRVAAYKNMINTLLQINNVAQNEIGEQTKGENKENGSLNQSFEVKKNKSITITIDLNKSEEFVNYVQNKENLYFATNFRVFKFVISGEKKGILQQVLKLQKGILVQAFQNKLYMTLPNLYVATQNGNFLRKNKNIMMPSNKQKRVKTQQTQTEALSDVLLDQIQEKRLSQMIDDLLLKKQIKQVETQTPSSQDLQSPKQQSIINEKSGKLSEIEKKSSVQMSIGDNFPMCPNSHQNSLIKIQSMLQAQQQIHKKTIQNLTQIIKIEQEKAKGEVLKKIQVLLGQVMSNNVIPLVQDYIRHSFQTKLQQVNVYLYSLAMQNLLLLKQEIQKDQVKENMIRDELIKRHFHEVSQSKKAVAEMVEICKKRELQKIIFFDEVKKKFEQIEKKVLGLQDKVKAILQTQEVSQAKLLDEVEVIKSMINHQKNRKKSIIIEEKQKDKEKEKGKKEDKSIEKSQQNDQQNDSSSDDSEQSDSVTLSEQENSSVSSTIKHEIAILKTKTFRQIYPSTSPPYQLYQGLSHQYLQPGYYPQMQFQPGYSPYPSPYPPQHPYFNSPAYSQASIYNYSPPIPQRFAQLPFLQQTLSSHVQTPQMPMPQMQIESSQLRNRSPELERQIMMQKNKEKSKQKTNESKIKKKKKKGK